MSDLSNLLGDVYGDHSPDSAPVRREPSADERAPEWSSESSLDRAFSGWVPGEPPTGSDDLTAALSAALTTTPAPVAAPAPAPTPAPLPVAQAPAPAVHLSEPAAPKPAWTSAPAPVPAMAGAPMPAMAVSRQWSPADDDIFPSARGGKKKKK